MLKTLHLLFILIPLFGASQIKITGTPNITNYLKSDYNAGTQNWGITDDLNGFMYFANNDGLLLFDGIYWELNQFLTSSALRSICIDKKNTIYVGAYNDFGCLKKDDNGQAKYKSLRHLIPSNIIDFDDIWRIFDTKYGIVFQSFDYLFILNDGVIQVLKPQIKFQFSFYVNERLFINEPGLGLFEYKDKNIQKLNWSNKLDKDEIWSILPLNNNQLIIGTAQNGLYLLKDNQLSEWEKPVNTFLKTNKLYCATTFQNNHFAFGTILGGLIITDEQGNIEQHIDKNNGLQNNTVLSIFADRRENLWLGLDNGIDYIEVSSPISFISDVSELGTGYACRVFENNLYLGTNQGLFIKSFEKLEGNQDKFKLVENTAGQVWSLDVFDGQLICCHNTGTFRVDGKKATRIGPREGTWKFIELINHPDYILGGYYNGLVLFKASKKGWVFDRKINGFCQSTRYLCQNNDGTIWISHGNKGIFQIDLNESLDAVTYLKCYNGKDGLPSSVGNIVYKLKNDIIVSTIQGFYRFNAERSTFEPSQKYNELFDIQGRLKTFQLDESGNIWYIAAKESGVIRLNEDLTYTKIETPFKRLNEKYVDEFEFVYPYNEENIFFGIETGFAHYSSKLPKSYSVPFHSYITKVELPYLDSILYINQISTSNQKNKFPFRKNSFRFYFTANFYETADNLVFSYFLDGYSDKWSNWSSFAYKDFTNLKEGNYTLKLKARNAYASESEIASFQFSIRPPWFRSTLAWCLYLIVFLLISFLIINLIIRRFQFIKEKEKSKHEQELRKKEAQFEHERIITEKELIVLRNEKLSNEMVYRDKELANQTMNLIQKNRSFSKLNEELLRIQNSTNDGLVKTKMVVLRKRIEKEIDDEQQNKIFEIYFDEVHADFFKHLKEKYPQLSPKDLRLCAYIKMNMSTKEISSLLNITYRGAEINRYRLRKKLDLPREVNLPTFLTNI